MFFRNWLQSMGLNSLGNRPARRHRRQAGRTIPVSAEVCETRQLLAASAIMLSEGAVSITGNANADIVNVSYVNNQQQVKVTHKQGSVTNTQIFEASSVTQINFNGLDGNDKFTNNTSITSQADGGKGNDTLQGGSGVDFLSGGEGNDSLLGKLGDDSLNGGAGNDNLIGDKGNDNIEGEAGNDTLAGGEGDDMYFFQGSTNLGQDTIKRDVSGNDDLGVNTLEFGGFQAGIKLDLSKTTVQQVAPTLKLKFESTGAIDNLTGTSFVDLIIGNHLANFLIGGSGNDSINGLDGNDTILGDSGNDLLEGGNGADQIRGSDGNDILRGGDGNDELIGGLGGDDLAGENGVDVLTPQNTSSDAADLADRANLISTDGAIDLMRGTLFAGVRTPDTLQLTTADAPLRHITVMATGNIPSAYATEVANVMTDISNMLYAVGGYQIFPTVFSRETITIEFQWKDGARLGTLASAKPSYMEEVDGLYYPVALANHLTRFDGNSVLPEGYVTVDALDFPLNGTGRASDIRTTLLHEVGHILGYSSLLTATGTFETYEKSENGSTTPERVISKYASLLKDGTGSRLTELSDSDVANAVVGNRSGLFFNGTHTKANNGGSTVRVYTPSTYEPGSSVSHLDEAGATQFALMSPAVSSDSREQTSYSSVELSILADLGWNVNIPAPAAPPVAPPAAPPPTTTAPTTTSERNDVAQGAQDLGILSFRETRTINGSIHATDPADFYKIFYAGASPTGVSFVTVTLSGMIADLDVDIQGSLSGSHFGSRSGTRDESVTFMTTPGDQISVKVYPFQGAVSGYTLKIESFN